MTKNERVTIKFTVTKDEYERLTEQATANGKKVNGYCRDIVLKKRHKPVNRNKELLTAILADTDVISKVRMDFDRLILAVVQDKILYASDINQMEQMITTLEERQAELLRLVRERDG